MKAETVAGGGTDAGALAGRERDGDTLALAGREPEGEAPALAGREPDGNAPALAGRERDGDTLALAGREPDGNAPALAGREPDSDAPAETGRISAGADAEPASDTLPGQQTDAHTSGEGARESDGGTPALAGRIAAGTDTEPGSDALPGQQADANALAGGEDTDADTEGEGEPADDTPTASADTGARAQGDAEPADDARPTQRTAPGTPAGNTDTDTEAESAEPANDAQPVQQTDPRTTKDTDVEGDAESADETTAAVPAEGAPDQAGSVTDADADTTAGKRPGGAGPEPADDTTAGGKGTADAADGTSARRGTDRPRPSWAKAESPARDRAGEAAAPVPEGTGDEAARTGTARPRPAWALDDDQPTPGAREQAPATGTADAEPARPAKEAAAPGKGAPDPRTPPPGARGHGPAAGGRTQGGAVDGSPARWTRPHDPERTREFAALGDPAAPRPGTVPRPVPRPVPEPARQAPVAPLELLAELTNTAPPPQTPRRTLTRRVKVWAPVVLLLGAAVAGGQMLRPLPAPRFVPAQTSYTLDGSTPVPWPAKGQAAVRVAGSGDIGTFGEQKPVPTASVAKVMTAYVVLKGHPLRKNDPGPKIEVDAKAVADGTSEDESRIEGLTTGQKFSQLDMIKMLMIPSGNNVARLLARWDTGSADEAAFVAKMNAAARELGMKDTTYTDPSGLDAGTVSTAVDQLKLAEAVMKDEAFRSVVAMPSATIDGLPKPINNNNDNLLLAPGLSIKGIKTGSSTPAGGTLMWAAYKTVGGETPLILGTMMDQRVDGPDPNAANSLKLVKENSRKVIEAVRAALGPVTVIRKGQLVGHVSDGLGGSTPLVAAKDLTVIGVPGQRLRLALGAGTKPLPHEAEAGTEVGVLTVGEGSGAKSVPVAVGRDLAEPSFGARVTRLS
ncbi:serine hydrolase [Streptomyces sp. NPDC012794]|uniref:serine hydrolase n=1 Tax=Streptomyces sp. NPDC012794 TaxID=3364850 RepID=UPI0036B0E33B